MEFLFEIIFQVLCEVLIQILFELGFHSLVEPFKNRPNPYFAFISYAILGAVAGGLSLLFFKELFVKNEILKVINLFLTPCLVGLAMSSLGKLRERNGRELINLDKFAYGFVFAFGMALVRFLSLD